MQILPVRAHESLAVLRQHLAGCGMPHLLLNEDESCQNGWYSILVESRERVVTMALASCGQMPEPLAVQFRDKQSLLIGNDVRLTWVDLEGLSVVASFEDLGVPYEFMTLEREDEVLVVHELGALRVDALGHVAWTVSTDVVTDFVLGDDGWLTLKEMDGASVAVSIATGECKWGA